MTSRVFGVGFSGPELTPGERRILERHAPGAAILFRRNIESLEQTRALVAELERTGAFICLDQEGGAVDRLRALLGPSLSFFAASRAGVSRRAGELAGEACALVGVSVDLAPVVDRRLPGASAEVLRDRCASDDPATISRDALEFLSGLHSRGVGGCVKHFPGLGRAALDTHRELPLLPDDPREQALDLAPFEATMGTAGAVMISHAAGADGLPASLSPAVATRLLRERLGFSGAAFSDDLEMGALSRFGGLARVCAAASRAGCDLLFVCSRIEEYPDCVASLEREVPAARRREAAARLESYAEKLRVLRASAQPPLPVQELRAEIARLADDAGEARG